MIRAEILVRVRQTLRSLLADPRRWSNVHRLPLSVSFCIATIMVAASALLHAAEIGLAGMPYTAMDHPQFLQASQATFLNSGDLVVGVAEGSVAKAYPAAILAQHGIVQDEMPNGPIAVTWCSICNTALVFWATADGKTLLFDPDGLVGANEVLRDRQTGSRWQQSTATAISGPLKGDHLKLYPFLLTTWREWHKQHPKTLVLKPLPGYREQLAMVNEVLHQGALGMAGPAPMGAFGHDSRLRPRDMIVGLETGGVEKAYPLALLQKVRVVNDVVGGTPVVIVHQPSSDTTTAFVAKVDGKDLQFQASGKQANKLIDLETHSTWTAYGNCVAGQFKGERLKRLILEPEFWFAWSEFHPKALLYRSGSKP